MNSGMQTSSSLRKPSSPRHFADEIVDQDHQASSLAAAGLVADGVSVAGVTGPIAQGLQAPPPLAPGSSAPLAAPSTELDSINWNLLNMGSSNQLDELDVDFAQLFDPASEAELVHSEGNSWPRNGESNGSAAM